MNIDWPSFLVGTGITLNVCGGFYWTTVARMRREDVAWRNEARKRIDDLAERSEREYARARREIGLPPRIVS